MDPTTRRSFVRKSLATTMAFTFTGLIRAHGEEGGGETTNTTVATTHATTIATTLATTVTTSLNVWWKIYKWTAPDSIDVPGGPNDSASLLLNKAIQKRHETTPGVLVPPPHLEVGGTTVSPARYVPVSAPLIGGTNPTFSYNSTTKMWTLTFEANYEYKEILMEAAVE